MTTIISTALSKLYGGTPARLVAQSLARETLAKSGLKSPPFNPFEIAKTLNITVRDGNLAGAEGVLHDFRSSAPVITLAKPPSDHIGLRYRRRMNFTVAHEIGHFVIRRLITGFVPTRVFDLEHEDEESLCNGFASELLMPRDHILQTFEYRGFSPKALIEIADRYEVSLTALLTRAAMLWHPYFNAILWSGDKFRIKPYWACPKDSIRAILCDTGRTCVERAFDSTNEEHSTADLLIKGERFRWQCISLKLKEAALGDSAMVVTILHRASSAANKTLPKAPCRDHVQPQRIEPKNILAVQQVLPFPVTRSVAAARRKKFKRS